MNRTTALNSTADGYFKDFDRRSREPSTNVEAKDRNAVQEEIVQTIEAANIPLQELDPLTLGLETAQLPDAIRVLAKRVSLEVMPANITLYATDADSDISSYLTLVSNTSAPEYNTTTVDIATGPITAMNQHIASLAAPPGLFIGNPGVITISTAGAIAKTAGNKNAFAEFYFEAYIRDSIGTETLIATSSATGAVNPDDALYHEFVELALLNNGEFTATDRVVIKYYANLLGGDSPEYSFQFGGAAPVQTSMPVPLYMVSSTAWVTPASLLNSWTGTIRYRRSADTITIQFENIDGSAKTSDTLLSLPAYAPTEQCYNALTAGYAMIDTSGDVQCTGTSAGIYGSLTYPL